MEPEPTPQEQAPTTLLKKDIFTEVGSTLHPENKEKIESMESIPALVQHLAQKWTDRVCKVTERDRGGEAGIEEAKTILTPFADAFPETLEVTKECVPEDYYHPKNGRVISPGRIPIGLFYTQILESTQTRHVIITKEIPLSIDLGVGQTKGHLLIQNFNPKGTTFCESEGGVVTFDSRGEDLESRLPTIEYNPFYESKATVIVKGQYDSITLGSQANGVLFGTTDYLHLTTGAFVYLKGNAKKLVVWDPSIINTFYPGLISYTTRAKRQITPSKNQVHAHYTGFFSTLYSFTKEIKTETDPFLIKEKMDGLREYLLKEST